MGKKPLRTSCRLPVSMTVLFSLMFTFSVHAGDTWMDSEGRFTIDLPKKWKLEKMEDVTSAEEIKEQVLETQPDADFSDYTDEDLTAVSFKFSSKKQKVSADVIFTPSIVELGHTEVFQTAVDSLPDAGLADIAPVGDVSDTEIDGKPARWGVYRGVVAGTTIALYSHIGAVTLEKGTIQFLAMMSESKNKALAGDIEAMFRSIR